MLAAMLAFNAYLSHRFAVTLVFILVDWMARVSDSATGRLCAVLGAATTALVLYFVRLVERGFFGALQITFAYLLLWHALGAHASKLALIGTTVAATYATFRGIDDIRASAASVNLSESGTRKDG